MRNLILGTAALALAGLAPLAATTQARADIEYPYCGYGREGAGGCTFATLDQCRAFVSGTGGACYQQPPLHGQRGRHDAHPPLTKRAKCCQSGLFRGSSGANSAVLTVS